VTDVTDIASEVCVLEVSVAVEERVMLGDRFPNGTTGFPTVADSSWVLTASGAVGAG